MEHCLRQTVIALRIAGHRPVEQVDVAEDVPAAVEEQHGRARCRGALDVPPQLDLRAVLGGRVMLAGRHVRRNRLRRARGADDRLPHGTAPGDVAHRGRREARLGHRGQRRGDLGIDGQ
jgi:hypothetical protein